MPYHTLPKPTLPSSALPCPAPPGPTILHCPSIPPFSTSSALARLTLSYPTTNPHFLPYLDLLYPTLSYILTYIILLFFSFYPTPALPTLHSYTNIP